MKTIIPRFLLFTAIRLSFFWFVHFFVEWLVGEEEPINDVRKEED